MLNSATRILVIGLVLGISGCLLAPTPASAGSPQFTLFTDGTGWGSTNTSLTNPGPTLVVDQGDNVTLILNGTDGSNHAWYIDYDNNTHQNGAEPVSPQFRSTARSWNFTANTNGTYWYRDTRNPNAVGQITIRQPSGPGGLLGDSGTLVIALGAIIAFVAVIALLYFMMQRKSRVVKEPRKEQE